MKIKQVKIKNIGPFRGTHTVEIPQKGVVLLSGVFESKQGSSGSGKTTLIQAILSSFGLSDVANKDMLTWGESEGEVEVDFERNEKLYKIKKTFSDKGASKTTLIGEGISAVVSSKDATEKLWQELSIDKDVFSFLVHQGQSSRLGRNGIDFVSMPDEEKKSFLGNMIEIKMYEEAAQKIKEKISKKRQSCTEKQSALSALEQTIPQEIPPPETNNYMTEEEYQDKKKTILQEYQDKKKEYEKNFEKVESKNVQIRQEKAIIDDLIKKEELALVEISAELTSIEKALAREKEVFESKREVSIKNIKEKGAKAKNDYLSARDKYKKTLESVCPECGQNLSSHTEMLSKYEKDMTENSEVIQECKRLFEQEQKQQWIPNESYLTRKEELTRHGKYAAGRLKQLMAKKEAVEKQLSIWKLPAPQDFGITDSALSDLESAWKHQQKQKERDEIEGKRYQSYLESRKKHKDLIEANQKEIEREEQEVEYLTELHDIVGQKGFCGEIFQGIIEEVEAKANEYSSRIQNVEHLRVLIRLEDETKTGKTKKRITIKIQNEQGDELPAKNPFLSGGQQQSLFVAIEMALRHVLENRGNKNIGFIFMDEPMDGLGIVEKENILSILEETEKTVILVDHSTEIHEMTQNKIIIKRGKETNIVVETSK